MTRRGSGLLVGAVAVLLARGALAAGDTESSLAAGAAAGADPRAPTVGASLDRTEAHVGDRLTLTVTAVARDLIADSVRLPVKLDLGKFELLDTTSADRDLGDGKKSRRFVLQIAAYEVGELQVPPIAIEYRSARGETRIEQTASIEVAVKPIVDDPKAELQPLQKQRTVLVEDRRPLQALAGAGAGAGTLVAAWLVGRLLRRRGAKPRVEAIEVVRPPHEVALDRLRAIRQRGDFGRDGFQPFHFEVAEVVRAWLGARFGFDSLELTTTELLAELRRVTLEAVARAAPDAASPSTNGVRDGEAATRLAQPQAGSQPNAPAAPIDAQDSDAARTVAQPVSVPLAAVVEFLEECDLVKFAKAPSTDPAARRLLDMAETIVMTTLPVAGVATAAASIPAAAATGGGGNG